MTDPVLELDTATEDEQILFNLDQFNDPAILRSTCMVCALPVHVRRSVEKKVFLNRDNDIASIAEEHNLIESDIVDHVENCILGRNTLIPMGQMIQSWVEETNSFISNFARFKTALIDGGEIDADGVTAYSTAMDKLRVTVRDFQKIIDPDNLASRLKHNVLNPLIISFYRILAEEMNYLIRESKRYIPERMRVEYTDMIKNLSKRIGIKHNESLENIKAALIEQTGANPKSVS